MARAVWKGVVLAESEDVKVVEGSHYFPPDSIRWEHLHESRRRTVCPWKGRAVYYHIEVAGDLNMNAAWRYPEPKPAARQIAGHVAFWKGVQVEE
ncbi:MAG: DUF427 domain-containing protein [Anaerolineae bacterium]